MEYYLALVHCTLVEDLNGDVFRCKVNAFASCLFEHRREQSHLEFEGQHVYSRGTTLAAFSDDFLNEQAPDWQVDRSDDHQPSIAGAVEEAVLRLCSAEASCLVCPQD